MSRNMLVLGAMMVAVTRRMQASPTVLRSDGNGAQMASAEMWGGAGGGYEIGIMAGTVYNDGDPNLEDFGLEATVYVEKEIVPMLKAQIRGSYTIQDVKNPAAGVDSVVGGTVAAVIKVVVPVPGTGFEVYGGGGVGYRFDTSDFGSIVADIDDDLLYLFLAGAKYELSERFNVGLEAGYQIVKPDLTILAVPSELDLKNLYIRVSAGLSF